jgi:hypothetical protein
MTLCVVQFSETSCYFLSVFKSKYFPRHPVVLSDTFTLYNPGLTPHTKFIVILKKNFVSQKDNEIPQQDYSGPEGSRKLRFPDFETIGT